ncbi:carbohydrate ABC transporter permease [Georgenia sp. TF02-10]|uniref:carbohydrate ABC transporter permease n=1 Tax=Georgenia sp. TF02-10 TaxID=2917725 RepID=UPI001FA72A94|nr:carbohydrate ABC transporter permease [Georgenia sp. TF02-10]UNX53237.1 carbohydrate ABC transporter permease [Georgenia sp. TF02-10]
MSTDVAERTTAPATAGSPPRGSTRLKAERITWSVLKWVTIAVTILASAGPLVYGLTMSVRSQPDIFGNPLNIFPSFAEMDFSSYPTALRSEAEGGFGLGRFMLNSLWVSLGAVLGSVAFSVLGAYAAVRLRFKGRNVVNAMFLMVYLFPGIVLAVPLFVLFSRVGLRGELVGLMIIYLAQTVPVAIYMLRNYFLAVPEGIEEAAMLDGCTRMQIVRKIVLPLALPGLVSTALYVFMIAWNEYLYALLFLVDRRDSWTVSLGIAQLSDFAVPATVLMAGSMAMTIPIVVVFVLAQRSLLSGLTAGAEKG